MATVYRHTRGEHVPLGDLNGNTSATTAEVMGEDIEKCSFCGCRNSAGYWMGVETVKACYHCALSILPALAADALIGERGNGPHVIEHLRRDLDRMAANFWRAAATAIHRGAKL